MLDLAGNWASQANFTTRLDVSMFPDSQLLEDLWKLGGARVSLKRKRSALFATQYIQSNRRHTAFGEVGPADKQQGHTLRFAWIRSLPRADVAAAGIEVLLDHLSRVNLTCSFRCHVDFAFPRDDFRSLVPLPIRLFQGSSILFDHLGGIRLVKIEERRPIRSAIIDLETNKLRIHVFYNRDLLMSRRLPEELFRGAKEIVQSLLVPSEKVTRWLTP